MGLDFVAVARTDQRGNLGLCFERVADPQTLRGCDELGNECVVDAALDEQAGTGDAGLMKEMVVKMMN